MIVKGWPKMYWSHFFTAEVIVASSLTYVDAQRSFWLKGLLKYAMGCPFCDNTAPIPVLDTSVSIVNGS